MKVQTSGRLTINDVDMMLTACEQGHGIAQLLEFAAKGLHDGRLVDLFPEWNEERFPLYVYFPSRRHPAAKVRAFVEFLTAAVRQQ